MSAAQPLRAAIAIARPWTCRRVVPAAGGHCGERLARKIANIREMARERSVVAGNATDDIGERVGYKNRYNGRNVGPFNRFALAKRNEIDFRPSRGRLHPDICDTARYGPRHCQVGELLCVVTPDLGAMPCCCSSAGSTLPSSASEAALSKCGIADTFRRLSRHATKIAMVVAEMAVRRDRGSVFHKSRCTELLKRHSPTQDRPPVHRGERSSPVKVLEICASGSVGEGNIPTYSETGPHRRTGRHQIL
jgi:hypothetical protein